MSAASLLIGLAQEKVKTDRATIGLPGVESTHLLWVVDQADLEYRDAFERGGGEGIRTIASEDGGTLPDTTNLNGAVADAATSIIVDSVAGATSTGGAGLIRDENMIDIFEYTNGSSTTVTGVTDIDFAHEDDDQVQWLPKLPSDFQSFRGDKETPDGVLVSGIPYSYTTGEPSSFEFSIYESSTGKYLIFNDGASGDYVVRYNSTKSTIDEETDSVNLPVIDEGFIVWRVVEHIYLTLDPNGFLTQAQVARANANRILVAALKRRNVGKYVRLARHPLPRAQMVDPALYRQD